jgi:hypothetical protein
MILHGSALRNPVTLDTERVLVQRDICSFKCSCGFLRRKILGAAMIIPALIILSLASSALCEIPIKRIGVVQPKVTISELTVGGRLNYNKEWSKEGEANVREAIKGALKDQNIVTVPVTVNSKEVENELEDVVALYGAITESLLSYSLKYSKVGFPDNLHGTKALTLGPLTDLYGKLNVDALVMVYATDEISSGGRKLFMFDYGLRKGVTHMSVGVVDGEGVIRWFNRKSDTGYDLRSLSSTGKFMDKIFKGYKENR